MPSDLYSYLYSAEEKSFQQNRTPATQAVHNSPCTDLCHTRGAGPDPAQWLTQDPTLSRELPAKLEEFLWCKGCSWRLLIIKTRLGQSLRHTFQMSSPTPGAVIAACPRMFPSCSTLQTLLTASLFPSCDPTALSDWDKQMHGALQRVRMAWFLSQLRSRAVSSSQEPAPEGKQDPTQTWNKHITSVAALDSGDTAV